MNDTTVGFQITYFAAKDIHRLMGPYVECRGEKRIMTDFSHLDWIIVVESKSQNNLSILLFLECSLIRYSLYRMNECSRPVLLAKKRLVTYSLILHID